jgi:hypothetical protein
MNVGTGGRALQPTVSGLICPLTYANKDDLACVLFGELSLALLSASFLLSGFQQQFFLVNVDKLPRYF